MIDTILLIPVSLGYAWLKPCIKCSPDYLKCHVLNANGQEIIFDLDTRLKIHIKPSLETHTIVTITNTHEELDDTIRECYRLAPEVRKLVVVPYKCKWSTNWHSLAETHNLELEVINEIPTSIRNLTSLSG